MFYKKLTCEINKKQCWADLSANIKKRFFFKSKWVINYGVEEWKNWQVVNSPSPKKARRILKNSTLILFKVNKHRLASTIE